MNVSILCFGFEGGMTHYAESLRDGLSRLTATELIKLGYKKDGESNTSVDQRRNITFYKTGIAHKVLEKYRPGFYREFATSIIREFSPRTVHVVNRFPCLYEMTKYFLSQGVNVVYTVHDVIRHEERITAIGRIYDGVYWYIQLPKLLRLPIMIHVHSEQHKSELLKRHGEAVGERIYVVRHGANNPQSIRKGEAVPRELQKLDARSFKILFFGRIEKYKGLPQLIDCVRMLQLKKSDVQLVIAGAGVVEYPCSRMPSNTVLINRFINDDEIKSIFESANVVVLPYRSATQSGVIPLAYSFGKPVIATEVGAISELIMPGVTGLTVPAENHAALCEAIEKLQRNHGLCERMGTAAFEFVNDALSVEKIAKEHYMVYHNGLH